MRGETYFSAIVRIAIALVFLWFGINQLLLPEDFMGYLPEFLLNSDFATTAVIANGIFETVLGFALLVGLFTKIVAAILGIHLLIITFSLGYNDIAVRDFGLAIVTLALIFGGKQKWSIDSKRQS